jgi:hypothetical protein
MLRIFEINHGDGEKEWITGATNIEALANYVSTTDCDLSEMDGAEISELPKEKWGTYIVKQEDDEEQTFEEWMSKNGNKPDIIAGTMYEV